MVRGRIKRSNLGLSKPVNMGGVEKSFMVINITVASIIFLSGFPNLIAALFIPQWLIFHMIGRAIYKSDPYFFEIFKKYRRYDRKVTKYMPAQCSVKSQGLPFIPRSVMIKGVKKMTAE